MSEELDKRIETKKEYASMRLRGGDEELTGEKREGPYDYGSFMFTVVWTL